MLVVPSRYVAFARAVALRQHRVHIIEGLLPAILRDHPWLELHLAPIGEFDRLRGAEHPIFKYGMDRVHLGTLTATIVDTP